MEQLKKCYEGYPNKVNFINEVIKFWSLKDTKVLATAPIAESKIVDLYELYNQVTMRGGYDAVCASKRWSEVAAACGIQSMLVVFQMYQLYLLQFEKTIKYHITQNRYGAAPGQGIIAGAGPAMGTGMVAATLPTGMIPSSGYASQQPQQPPAQQVPQQASASSSSAVPQQIQQQPYQPQSQQVQQTGGQPSTVSLSSPHPVIPPLNFQQQQQQLMASRMQTGNIMNPSAAYVQQQLQPQHPHSQVHPQPHQQTLPQPPPQSHPQQHLSQPQSHAQQGSQHAQYMMVPPMPVLSPLPVTTVTASTVPTTTAGSTAATGPVASQSQSTTTATAVTATTAAAATTTTTATTTSSSSSHAHRRSTGGSSSSSSSSAAAGAGSGAAAATTGAATTTTTTVAPSTTTTVVLSVNPAPTPAAMIAAGNPYGNPLQPALDKNVNAVRDLDSTDIQTVIRALNWITQRSMDNESSGFNLESYPYLLLALCDLMDVVNPLIAFMPSFAGENESSAPELPRYESQEAWAYPSFAKNQLFKVCTA
jgi:hypothetical protein